MTASLHVERDPDGADAPGDGAGLPIVFLHGWGMNLRVFDPLRAALRAPSAAAPLRTWAIDLPGCGRSPWWSGAEAFEAQCAAVLAALPPRCVLAGWSFGAQVAMALAATAAPRIAALVLLAATPRFVRGTGWSHGSDPATLAALQSSLLQDWRQVMEDFLWLQVRGSQQAEATRQQLEASLASQGTPRREALIAGLQLLATLDLRADLADVHQPVLVISGLHDRVVLPDAGRWLAQALPGAKLVELPRAGHAPIISHAPEVAAALRDFLVAQSSTVAP